MKFYVYRLFHDDMTLYIGKGSGGRLTKQKRHFCVDGEILASFDDEAEAYQEEMRLIAVHEPPLNKHPGGQGGRAGQRSWRPVDLPNGLSPEGLKHAAPYLARLLITWSRDTSLNGILNVLGVYLKAHGQEALENAVVPHIRRIHSIA